MTRGRWQAVSVAALVLHASGLAYAAEPTNPAAAVVKTHIMVAPDAIAWEDCSPALPPGARCATIERTTRATAAEPHRATRRRKSSIPTTR